MMNLLSEYIHQSPDDSYPLLRIVQQATIDDFHLGPYIPLQKIKLGSGQEN